MTERLYRYRYPTGGTSVYYETQAELDKEWGQIGGSLETADLAWDANDEWVPAKWHDLTADTEDGQPVGDTIRLTWDDGTRLIGRLTVPSYGSGHHQLCRMQTVFGGDTYVWPHGSTLERRRAVGVQTEEKTE